MQSYTYPAPTAGIRFSRWSTRYARCDGSTQARAYAEDSAEKGKPVEIPVPKRKDFDSLLKRAAKPKKS